MTVYHIPTVYLILGILYLILPLTVWALLFNQPSRALTLWCSGGLLFGVALALVGLRAHLPAWVSYTVANGLMWSAVLMQAFALRRALDQRLVLMRGAVLVLVCVLGFESRLFRQYVFTYLNNINSSSKYLKTILLFGATYSNTAT